MPLRNSVELAENAQLLLMPGSRPDLNTAGIKVLSLFPDNRNHGKPVIQGFVALFDATDGSPLAVIDAASLTAIRTAAASAAATRVLANESASSLAILGYGVQAASHLQAMLCVRDIRRVRIWGPDPERCAAFVDQHQSSAITIETASSAREAVIDADLICAPKRSLERLAKYCCTGSAAEQTPPRSRFIKVSVMSPRISPPPATFLIS